MDFEGDEKEDPRHEQKEDARNIQKTMQSLVDHAGWKSFKMLVDMQVKHRQDIILLAPATDTLAQEFMKGECAGIRAMMSLPGKLLEDATSTLELFKKERE